MKRRLLSILTAALLLSVLALPVSAENTASRVDAYCTVYTNGDVQVNLTVTLRLEAAQETLYFPLPGNATDISLNGAGARTSKTGSTVDVDVSRVVSGLVGEFSLRIDYTIPDAVKIIQNEKTLERSLQLQLPLVSGFSYPVEQLIQTVRRYQETTGRRVSFEYSMVRGVNDSDVCAKQLADLIRGMGAHVNLIPINPVDGSPYSATDAANVRRFQQKLESLGVNATVRRRLGSEISAACGQLRRDEMNGKA